MIRTIKNMKSENLLIVVSTIFVLIGIGLLVWPEYRMMQGDALPHSSYIKLVVIAVGSILGGVILFYNTLCYMRWR